MARRCRPRVNDSDVPSADEDGSDIFDIVKDEGGSDTDVTSFEDPDIDDVDVDKEADIEDQITLFEGNVHPPEHYR
jgi:hypothetical protein